MIKINKPSSHITKSDITNSINAKKYINPQSKCKYDIINKCRLHLLHSSQKA